MNLALPVHPLRSTLAALLIAVGAGCSKESVQPDPAPPEEPPPTTPQRKPVVFTSGRGIADTVGANATTPLTVNVVGPNGAPRAGVTVLFDFVASDGISPPTRTGLGSFSSRFKATDAAGNATVSLQLGSVVGTWVLRAFDQQTGDADTLSFTVRPGKPAKLVVAPEDTAVYLGNSYSLAAVVTDRVGNPVTGSVRFSVDSGGNAANVGADGRVGGSSFGRTRLIAELTGTPAAATARVTVVPPGVLAVNNSGGSLDNGIVTVNIDGSGVRLLSRDGGASPSWSPDGSAIAYNVGIALGVLYRVDLTGVRTKLSRLGALSTEIYPRYSPDGQFIYYTGGVYPDSLDTYRMRVDGSDTPVRITPLRPISSRYWHASPSPDGTRLVYSENGTRLHIYTLANQSDRPFANEGLPDLPRFSPDGAWIAYTDTDSRTVKIVRPDETGRRQLTPSGAFAGVHDWSPDGAWIVYRAVDLLYLVRVADGLTLPLPFSRYYDAPVWRPR